MAFIITPARDECTCIRQYAFTTWTSGIGDTESGTVTKTAKPRTSKLFLAAVRTKVKTYSKRLCSARLISLSRPSLMNDYE
jgi:hypothetical protein